MIYAGYDNAPEFILQIMIAVKLVLLIYWIKSRINQLTKITVFNVTHFRYLIFEKIPLLANRFTSEKNVKLN